MALYQPVVGHFSNLTVAAGLKRQRNSGGLFEFASTVPVYCEHLEVCVCVYLDEAAEQAASRQGSWQRPPEDSRGTRWDFQRVRDASCEILHPLGNVAPLQASVASN